MILVYLLSKVIGLSTLPLKMPFRNDTGLYQVHTILEIGNCTSNPDADNEQNLTSILFK
jgi:hypothetical protein